MSDLRELYQEVILDHSRHPRNLRKNATATRTAEGFNPLCGDRITLYVTIDADTVTDLSFQGSGCAISTAAASMLTEALKGKSLAEVSALFSEFHGLVTGAQEPSPRLGKLAIFRGVSEFPVRVKCATLPWHTLCAALENKEEIITTE